MWRLSAPQSLPNYSPSNPPPCHVILGEHCPLGIILNGGGIETKDIIWDCIGLQLITKDILETATGGYLVEFWSLKCLAMRLTSPLVKGDGGYQKNSVNLCKAGPQKQTLTTAGPAKTNPVTPDGSKTYQKGTARPSNRS